MRPAAFLGNKEGPVSLLYIIPVGGINSQLCFLGLFNSLIIR